LSYLGINIILAYSVWMQRMTEIATGLEILAMNVTKTVVGPVAQTKKKGTRY
jgi:hypothetical protein